MTHLLLTVRFLDDRYHGLLDRGGPPEWPPSPFRLFQALVAGVARRGELVIGDDVPSNTNYTDIGASIDWLQKLAPPLIIAPKHQVGQSIIRFVPNNDGDKKFDRKDRLTAKPTIPTLFLLEPDQKPEVHYVWDISDCANPPVEKVRDAARSLTTLGWGIDMAFANADRADEAKLQSLKGIRWYPKRDTQRNGWMLRTPTYDDETKECTLCDLRHCHHSAKNRIEHGKPLKTVDKPKVFDRVLYASTERPIDRPYAIFKLLNDDEDTYSHPHGKIICIAGMLRHLAIEAMKRNPPPSIQDPAAWVERYVAGHRNAAGHPHLQLSYVPLPSVGHHHTDPSIRRVMIIAPIGDNDILEHISQQLDGLSLKPEHKCDLSRPVFLNRVRNDNVASHYTNPSNRWASVTPVILPGHDDHKPAKTRKLIEKALAQSGIEQPCTFEWSVYSHFPKSFSAHKYDKDKRQIGYIRPDHLKDQTAVHLTLTFTNGIEVPGPLTVGSGRHCGLGILASP